MRLRPVISRHRLRQPYRTLLTVGFLMPGPLLLLTILLGKGLTLALLDPRLLLPLLVMSFPALLVWHQGVDLHPKGLTARIHVPHYHAFADLRGWRLEDHPEGIVLTVWDQHEHTLAVHAAHLTQLPALLIALERHLDAPRQHRHDRA
jgi:hypothetical protein